MGWDAAAGSGSGENAGKTRRQDERRDGTVWVRHASLRGPFGVEICSEANFDRMSVDVWRIRRLASRQHRTTRAGTTTTTEQIAKYLRTAGVSSSKERAAEHNATQR